jgi:ABC-2 type transport system ATP-binding protein
VLSVREVRKAFGANSVLEGVSFDLQRGEMLCLLGANGAGKSTLFNVILENVEQDTGEVLRPFGARRVSFCPQHDLGWDYLTVAEHFDLVLAIQGPDRLPPRLAETVRDLTLLGGHWHTLAKDLSGGFKRRLTLALALLNDADLVLMDEPTTALDMEVRHHIMRGVSSARDQLGTTVLYTTHHLEDAENFSDSVLILAKGSVLLRGSVDELRRRFNLVTLRLFGAAAREAEVAAHIRSEGLFDCEVSADAGGALLVRLPSEGRQRLEKLVDHFERELGLAVDLRQTSLEDVYLMDGEFENYGSLEALGRVDLDDCWRRLTAAERRPGALRAFLLMLRKSSPA